MDFKILFSIFSHIVLVVLTKVSLALMLMLTLTNFTQCCILHQIFKIFSLFKRLNHK